MKKLLSFGLLFASLCVGSVSAHEFEKSNTLEALMYVEPHEEITAGEIATIHVEFQTAPANFTLADAHLKLIVLDGTVVLGEKTLADTDVVKTENTFYFPYTFSHDGMYTLAVTGTIGADTVVYHFDDIHVGMGEGFLHHLQYHFIHIIIFGSGIIAGFILAFWKPKKSVVVTKEE